MIIYCTLLFLKNKILGDIYHFNVPFMVNKLVGGYVRNGIKWLPP